MDTLTLRPMAQLPPFYSLRIAARAGWRSALRAWNLGRRRRALWLSERESLLELHRMDDRMLADIGLVRSDLPWMAQRDAFARLLEDVAAYNRAHWLSGPVAPRWARS